MEIGWLVSIESSHFVSFLLGRVKWLQSGHLFQLFVRMEQVFDRYFELICRQMVLYCLLLVLHHRVVSQLLEALQCPLLGTLSWRVHHHVLRLNLGFGFINTN